MTHYRLLQQIFDGCQQILVLFTNLHIVINTPTVRKLPSGDEAAMAKQHVGGPDNSLTCHSEKM